MLEREQYLVIMQAGSKQLNLFYTLQNNTKITRSDDHEFHRLSIIHLGLFQAQVEIFVELYSDIVLFE